MKPGRYGMPRNHAAWRQVNAREPENPHERRSGDEPPAELPVFHVEGLAREERRRQREAATKENKEADDFLERFGL